MKTKYLCAALALIGGAVCAQPVTPSPKKLLPTEKAMEQEMRNVEKQRKEVFSDPSLNNTRQLQNNFPMTPGAGVDNGIDLEALAQRYSQKVEVQKTADILVFASFSMPEASIRRVLAETARVGGQVVFRGFKNKSYKETALELARYGQTSTAVNINPNAFVKYKIKAVPAVVLTKPLPGEEQLDAEGCALPSAYVSLAGDVSLAYAIETIANKSKAFESQAQTYLRQLR